MARVNVVVLAAVFALGTIAAAAFAADEMAKGFNRPYGLSELVGSVVQNPKGDSLGRITDLVVDPHGRIAFAVLSHGGFLGMGGTFVAVPFEALTFNRTGRHFVMDITREKLDTAPVFSKEDLTSEKWAEEAYRYFGRQPYWTEGGLVMEGAETMEKEPMGMDEYSYPSYP